MTTNIVWNRDSSNDILPNPTPSPSQNLYAWAGDGSGENYTRSAADDIIVTPELPEHLYGWTDYHRTGTQLYKWYEPGTTLYAWSYRGSVVYTTSSMPLAGAIIYNADGSVNQNSPVEEDSDGATIYDGYSSWSRDSGNDIIQDEIVYYTRSATPTVGMHLYDVNNEDTGLAITVVNQDGSFDIYSSVSLTFTFSSTSHVTSLVIDGTTYSSSPVVVSLTENVQHSFEMNYTSYFAAIAINGYRITDDGTITCTFTIANNQVTFVGDYQTKTFSTTGSLEVYGTNCCIPYYTKVNYFDGSTKTAKEVQVGDKLLGYDETTQEFKEVEVLNVIYKKWSELVKITTENHEIEITPDHPILTDRGWAVYNPSVSTYDLNMIPLTDTLKVLDKTGNYEDIISIEYKQLNDPIDTYTFNVTDGIDTYVAADLISHNAPC